MTTRIDVVDPQTAALLRRLDAEDGGSDDLADLRRPWPADDPALLPPRPLAAVTDLLVPADPPIPVRIYVPDPPGRRPALIWLHPGGFVAGQLDDIDGLCCALADESGCVVVSIAYRLAPEHPFPAALDDVTAAVRWLGEHGATLGVDPDRLAIGGQSAGATLAASCAWQLRDDDASPRLVLQVLAYPVLDPRLDAPSYTENAEGFHFTPGGLGWSWQQYLGSRSADPPSAATPLYAESVRGVAPTLLLAAGRDPARDDSRRYRDKLLADDVEVELVEYPRTIHAFLSFAGVLDVAREALALIAATLRERLGSARPWLQHVTVPYATRREQATRAFYAEALGLSPKPVPEAFAGRGFIWFVAGDAGQELHLIPEEPTDDRSERHMCLAVARLEETVGCLRRLGHDVELHELIPDRPQAFVRDPSDNLLELTRLPRTNPW